MSGIRRDNLDKLFSQYVRARAGWRCECCGQTQPPLDCAHIVSRRHRNTRWDEANAICLCRACHMFFEEHPHDWTDWTRSNLGTDHVEAVRERAKSTDKVSEQEKADMADAFYQKLIEWGEKPTCTGKPKKSKSKSKASKYKRKVDGQTVKRSE